MENHGRFPKGSSLEQIGRFDRTRPEIYCGNMKYRYLIQYMRIRITDIYVLTIDNFSKSN